jgi:hypothetical protein
MKNAKNRNIIHMTKFSRNDSTRLTTIQYFNNMLTRAYLCLIMQKKTLTDKKFNLQRSCLIFFERMQPCRLVGSGRVKKICRNLVLFLGELYLILFFLYVLREILRKRDKISA